MLKLKFLMLFIIIIFATKIYTQAQKKKTYKMLCVHFETYFVAVF